MANRRSNHVATEAQQTQVPEPGGLRDLPMRALATIAHLPHPDTGGFPQGLSGHRGERCGQVGTYVEGGSRDASEFVYVVRQSARASGIFSPSSSEILRIPAGDRGGATVGSPYEAAPPSVRAQTNFPAPSRGSAEDADVAQRQSVTVPP
jgi:hypothetical protein